MISAGKKSGFLSEEALKTVVNNYGREVAGDIHHEKGYRNRSHSFLDSSGKRLNLILYKNEPDVANLIRRINSVTVQIKNHDIPVRYPIDQRIIKINHRYASLYNYLSGQTIPWEAFTKKHIKLLGMLMADIHRLGGSLTLPELPTIYEITNNQEVIVGEYLRQSGVVDALARKLNITIKSLPNQSDLRKYLAGLPGQTLLHMDLVRGNVLFEMGKSAGRYRIGDVNLSGVIDFEKIAIGHPLFDVARTLAFLLVDCPKDFFKVQNYFINSGYIKRGKVRLVPIKYRDKDILDQLITFHLIYDFYKFLKQNPYESLSKNHHFNRTVVALQARDVIT